LAYAKTFYDLDHFSKLSSVGGLARSTIFLIGRKQKVKIDEVMSEWSDLLSGIPQGSILGPVLFIIYINDLIESCRKNAKIYLFADDARLYNHIKCYSQKMINLQTGLTDG